MLFEEELTGAARWAVPLLIFAIVIAAGFVLRAFLFKALTRWSQRTSTKVDDHIIASTKYASYVWIVILGVLAAVQCVNLPGERIDIVVRRVLVALLILAVTFGVARFLGELAQEKGSSSTGLLRTMVRAGVLAIGIMIMLGTLGINITPLLGALGVGGLAAGLALQPTLSNFFAGFQVAASRQVRVGNRVRLASGEDGWVTDISWRTTTLLTPGNNLLLIPNSKFADSILTNFSLPDSVSNLTLTVNVAYDSDPRQVEEVLRDEARQLVAAIPELVKDSEPTIRLQTLGESALQFEIVLRVRDYDAQFAIRGELNQRILARLQREDISIPFPTRDVYLHRVPRPAPEA